MLLGQSNNLATTAMLIWLAINMMYIGSSVGTVLGGVMQQIIIQVIMLRLFTATRVRPALAGAGVLPPGRGVAESLGAESRSLIDATCTLLGCERVPR